jgi:hypothetical protein
MNLVHLTFLVDAHGDLLRGLQVVETSIGITSTLLGDKIEGIIISFVFDETSLAHAYINSQQGHGHRSQKTSAWRLC